MTPAENQAPVVHHDPSDVPPSSASFRRAGNLDYGEVPRRNWVFGYSLAILSVSIALGLRFMLGPFVQQQPPYMLLFAAVMASAAFGGMGPGLLATIGGGILAHFLFGRHDAISDLGIFMLEGILLSALGASLLAARHRAEESERANLELEQQILEISDEERRRVGYDLHDGLGQHLTGIALLSRVLMQRLETAGLPEAQQARSITDLVNESIGWTRDLARGLSPVPLETGGLIASLSDLAIRTSRLPGVQCELRCDESELPMEDYQAQHLFRIVQEAVNNSMKHGKAQLIGIEVDRDKNFTTLRVIDDGCGLSASTLSMPGMGLRIMQYRAKMIGATLTVYRASPVGGTVMTCRVPLRRLRKPDGEKP